MSGGVSRADTKKIMIIAYLKNLIRLLSVTNPSLAKKNVITGSSKANPKPKRSFVKKLTYSPMLGSALNSWAPKFTRKSKPRGTTI